jgi:hypothetical protein
MDLKHALEKQKELQETQQLILTYVYMRKTAWRKWRITELQEEQEEANVGEKSKCRLVQCAGSTRDLHWFPGYDTCLRKTEAAIWSLGLRALLCPVPQQLVRSHTGGFHNLQEAGMCKGLLDTKEAWGKASLCPMIRTRVWLIIEVFVFLYWCVRQGSSFVLVSHAYSTGEVLARANKTSYSMM